ncbi:WD repeat-containing protein 26 [Eumeta japonica]|uniref:WD repeat-containing protein 26 n=1 Tax=Eumeta variegata TaxID=151549 RepID=A0A4C1ZEE2_EUMVA|nr:WD repeat-containing protein 26 [Eumeta japonica]
MRTRSRNDHCPKRREGRCCIAKKERQLLFQFQLIFVYATNVTNDRGGGRDEDKELCCEGRGTSGGAQPSTVRSVGVTSAGSGLPRAEQRGADAGPSLVIEAARSARARRRADRVGRPPTPSLASSDSSGEDGAGHQPPRKRSRRLSPSPSPSPSPPAAPAPSPSPPPPPLHLSSPSTMHQPCANGTPQLNGDAPRNGDISPPGPHMSQTDQEIVRLIGQHLISIGLERSAALLMEESGLHLEHPAAATFRQHVLAGDWAKADHDLRALHELLKDSPHIQPDSLVEMKFLLLEQKYLEHLESGRVLDALHVLRNELTPLQHDTPRVHRLSALMMCADADELHARAHWPGAGSESRSAVLTRVQAQLPPALMMAPGRLAALLSQAAAHQASRCRFHAAPHPPRAPAPPIPFSLLADHHCSPDTFPIHPLQVLNEHCDEVWYCKWSPDGSKLASGSKDNTVMIWDFDPNAKRLSFRKTLEGHSYGVSFLAWSPDGRHLLAAGPEDCPDLWIWNMETEELQLKMTHSQEDSLTAVAWHASGDKFVTGGARGQFYQCNLDVSAAAPRPACLVLMSQPLHSFYNIPQL